MVGENSRVLLPYATSTKLPFSTFFFLSSFSIFLFCFWWEETVILSLSSLFMCNKLMQQLEHNTFLSLIFISHLSFEYLGRVWEVGCLT